MDTVDTLIFAGWLLPVAPENIALTQYGVAIANQRIVAVEPNETLAANYQAEQLFDLRDHIVLPGLINAHGHAAMTLLRGAGEDLSLQAWLNQTIWPLEAEHMDAEAVALGTQLAIAEMLATGTTTFSDMYYFPEAIASEAKAAGMRCQITFPIIQFATAWSQDADDALHKGLALHDAYRHDELIRVALGPHSAYTLTQKDLERVAMYANELNLGVQIHMHENAQEVAGAHQQIGRSWLALLRDIGLLSPQLQAVHMTQLTSEEIDWIAQSDTRIVHCPTSNMKLASGTCPVATLRQHGITVGLGTDGGASNNTLDMFAEMRHGALLAKLAQANPEHGRAKDQIKMATLDGAKTIGMESEVGSLEVGKAADICCVRTNRFASQPMHDAFAALVHGGAGCGVDHVFVNGNCVLRDGTLKRIDKDALLARTQRWWQSRFD